MMLNKLKKFSKGIIKKTFLMLGFKISKIPKEKRTALHVAAECLNAERVVAHKDIDRESHAERVNPPPRAERKRAGTQRTD